MQRQAREGNPQGLTLIQFEHEGRRLEMSAKEVTMGQLLEYQPEHKYVASMTPYLDCPACQVS